MNNTINQLDLRHPQECSTQQNSLSVYAYETFSEIDDMLDDKTSLSKLKRIEIINIIDLPCNGMKLPTEKSLNSQIKGN